MAVPSDEHLLAFGRIIHAYAAVESGIKIALSGILEIDLTYALIVFAPYGARDVKNVAKSLAKERLKPSLAEEFNCIVGDWSGYSHLRNTIAHSRWTLGLEPGAIKPRGVNIREGRAKFAGDGDDEKGYIASDLNDVVAKLDAINERLKRFLKSSGLAQIIETKIDAAKSDKSRSSGSDTRQSDR